MAIYHRELWLGSCAGEMLGWPAVILAAGLAISAVSWLAIRAIRLSGAWMLPWLFAGVSLACGGIGLAALAATSVTADLDRSGSDLLVAVCRRGSRVERQIPVSDVTGRFVLQERRNAPPTPLVQLRRGDEEVAQVWLLHPGLDVEALAALVPSVVVQFRRWQASR